MNSDQLITNFKLKLRNDRKFTLLLLVSILAVIFLPYVAIPVIILWWFYKKSSFSKKTKILTTSIVGGLLTLLVAMVGVAYSRDATPSLFLSEPNGDKVVQSQEIVLKGTYEPADRSVWVNGRQISAQNGTFETTYNLEEGKNEIEISAGNWKRARVNIIVTREVTKEKTPELQNDTEPTQEPKPVEKEANQDENESKKEETGNKAIAEYATAMLPVTTRMQTANEAVVKAGEAGGNMDFVSAGVYIQTAESDYQLAKDTLTSINPPSEAQTVHKTVGEALDKYLESVALYKEGIDSLDVDKIYEGINLYQEGTELVNKATEELNKLVDRI